MSFAVDTLPNIDVTTVPQPPAGSTVDTGTVAITDPNSATNPVVVGGNAIAALATVGSSVVLQGSASVTTGTDSAGNALAMGGSVIDASKADGVVVSLDGGNAGTASVPDSSLPGIIVNNAAASQYNTFTKLSEGNDQYSGTNFNDAVELSPGDDVIVTGAGDDIVSMLDSLKGGKKEFTLGTGKDQVLIGKGALANKGKIAISDFSRKEDVISIQAKKSKVKGIGSDTLKISTKDGKTIKVISDGTNFTKRSVDFI
jgi:hypothetical protein